MLARDLVVPVVEGRFYEFEKEAPLPPDPEVLKQAEKERLTYDLLIVGFLRLIAHCFHDLTSTREHDVRRHRHARAHTRTHTHTHHARLHAFIDRVLAGGGGHARDALLAEDFESLDDLIARAGDEVGVLVDMGVPYPKVLPLYACGFWYGMTFHFVQQPVTRLTLYHPPHPANHLSHQILAPASRADISTPLLTARTLAQTQIPSHAHDGTDSDTDATTRASVSDV